MIGKYVLIEHEFLRDIHQIKRVVGETKAFVLLAGLDPEDALTKRTKRAIVGTFSSIERAQQGILRLSKEIELLYVAERDAKAKYMRAVKALL